jgi:mannose-6-phosphate isomerase-like protein (cupin superfamily)
VDDLTAAATYTEPTGTGPGEADTHWVEHLRVPAMSLGTYSIRAGGRDEQIPHAEDEVYLVVSGRAGFESGGKRVEVGPGSTLFVPAHEVHRFLDVTEDLTLIVVFAPAESSG